MTAFNEDEFKNSMYDVLRQNGMSEKDILDLENVDIDSLDSAAEQLQERLDSIANAQGELDNITGSATVQGVSITIGKQNTLDHLSISKSAYQLGEQKLASLITQTYQKARHDLFQKTETVMSEALGEDSAQEFLGNFADYYANPDDGSSTTQEESPTDFTFTQSEEEEITRQPSSKDDFF